MLCGYRTAREEGRARAWLLTPPLPGVHSSRMRQKSRIVSIPNSPKPSAEAVLKQKHPGAGPSFVLRTSPCSLFYRWSAGRLLVFDCLQACCTRGPHTIVHFLHRTSPGLNQLLLSVGTSENTRKTMLQPQGRSRHRNHIEIGRRCHRGAPERVYGAWPWSVRERVTKARTAFPLSVPSPGQMVCV